MLLHRGTVLDISQAEIAYSEPQWAGSIWLKVCSPREKAAATAVLKSLGVKGRSPRIPPREALVTAILGGDRERGAALVHQGAEINDVPEGDPHPLFTAIQQSNVDAVKTMLELGADLQAEHYGTTLVGKAAHTIDLIGYRPGGVLGDPFADRHSRATEILQILREAGELRDDSGPAQVTSQG